MTIYYVDHSGDLNQILGEGGFDFIKMEDDPDECICDSGDLVFLHTVEDDEWISHAAGKQYTDFVFISRNAPNSLPSRTELTNNGYLCHIPAKELGQSRKFKEFIEKWKQGDKKWDLLLLDPCPDNLVALYILDVAAMESEKGDSLNENKRIKEIRDEIIGKARDEFIRLGGKIDGSKWSDINTRKNAVQGLFQRNAAQ